MSAHQNSATVRCDSERIPAAETATTVATPVELLQLIDDWLGNTGHDDDHPWRVEIAATLKAHSTTEVPPASAQRKAKARRLNLRKRRPNPYAGLPFVDWLGDGPKVMWRVPSPGGYSNGCAVGSDMARHYLRHLAEGIRRNDGLSAGSLQHIVEDINFSTDDAGQRGAWVGFLTELDLALCTEASRRHLGGIRVAQFKVLHASEQMAT